jgi:Bacterial transcriptional activator domain/Transcriptional regulatory protein, C terminal
VLSALLLRFGRMVTVEELAGALWGRQPPPSARATVQNYVIRLRRILAGSGPGMIVTRPGGYLISVGAGDLDVSRFERLLADAHAAARDHSWETAAARAGEALVLWRGEPLADAGSEFLAAREGPWLAEMRLQAIEAHVEAACTWSARRRPSPSSGPWSMPIRCASGCRLSSCSLCTGAVGVPRHWRPIRTRAGRWWRSSAPSQEPSCGIFISAYSLTIPP